MSDNKRKGFDIIGEIGREARKVDKPSKEVEKSTSKEVKKYNNYTVYKSIPVTKAMQGDKYKVNFSLSKEVAQKIQHIQATEGVSMRDYSKIAELAIDLLYDVKYLLSFKGENVINKKASELLELLGIDLKEEM